ncbi:MAG: glucokinase [Deltaproteobacteria bacterium]|nr:MAG: glucokinase [Deltaproteobacteria bacterium]
MDILAADIGGTNSRFAYFTVDAAGTLKLEESIWLKTQESASFANLLDQLKSSDLSLPPDRAEIAVIAVAGPVERGTHSRPPNISWEIDLSRANENFGLKRCLLINDFVAQAFACRSPVIESALQVIPGKIDPAQPLVVIGAGTGLGQAALIPQTAGGHIPLASEGGHASFPFETEAEFDYMKFLHHQTGETYVRADTVVSGRGLSLVHEYLTGEKLQPAEVAAKLHDDVQSLKWMSRFYGRICRNFALQLLAFGGVYIAGGVAARIPSLVTHQEFKTAFLRSKTMTHVLEKIPVMLNSNQESGLWGAALQGLELLGRP